MTAQDIIAQLNLAPHPEGGHYRQTWIGDGPGRASGTCIYFLLAAGERSHWHRVDATEIWHFHSGADLILRTAPGDSGPASAQVLSGDLTRGLPQIIVPENHWQSAQSKGDFTLVSCTVSPAFQFEGFTLAPAGFDIPEG